MHCKTLIIITFIRNTHLEVKGSSLVDIYKHSKILDRSSDSIFWPDGDTCYFQGNAYHNIYNANSGSELSKIDWWTSTSSIPSISSASSTTIVQLVPAVVLLVPLVPVVPIVPLIPAVHGILQQYYVSSGNYSILMSCQDLLNNFTSPICY